MNCQWPKCGCAEREQCKPTAPSVQPVRAWAVVDKDGRFDATNIYNNLTSADKVQKSYDKYCREDAPHRVIRVEIREVNNE